MLTISLCVYYGLFVSGFSLQTPGFASRAALVAFMVDKMVLEKIDLRCHWFYPVSIILPLFRIHSCIVWGMDIWAIRGSVPQGHCLVHRNNKNMRI